MQSKSGGARSILAFLTCLILACSGAACGDDGGLRIEDQPMQGTLGGDSWTYTFGVVREGFESGTRFLSFYATERQPDAPCAFDTLDYDNWQVFWSTELKEKRWELGTRTNVTFEKSAENYIATRGAYELTSIGASEIRGEIVAEYDSEFIVNGQFVATRCDGASSGGS